MPIDPQRFPASNRPKVEIRRRTGQPASAPVALKASVATAPASRPVERNRAEERPPAVAPAPATHVEEPYEPPTIFRLVFPDADEVSPATDAASQDEPSKRSEQEPSVVELVAVDQKPIVAQPAVDPRQALLGPSEMAVPEVPTLRYDAEELAPMLEEMAVRKVLLEQTLGRMRQALDEENAEIEREAAEIVAEREASSTSSSVSAGSAASGPELGGFFWFGSMAGTAILGWGMLWLLRGLLFDPSLLRTGGVLALFGLIAIGSNLALHLDALLPRSAARAEG